MSKYNIRKLFRWIPVYNEPYFYVSSKGTIDSQAWTDRTEDFFRLRHDNCYRRDWQADERFENIITESSLKLLAEELNNGIKMIKSGGGGVINDNRKTR